MPQLLQLFPEDDVGRSEYSRQTFRHHIAALHAQFEQLLADNQSLHAKACANGSYSGSSGDSCLATSFALYSGKPLSEIWMADGDDSVPLEPQASSIGLLQLQTQSGVACADLDAPQRGSTSNSRLQTTLPRITEEVNVTFDKQITGPDEEEEEGEDDGKRKKSVRGASRKFASDFLPRNLRDSSSENEDVFNRLTRTRASSDGARTRAGSDGAEERPTQRNSAASIHARMTLATKASQQSVLPSWYDPQEEVIISAKNIPSQNLLLRSDDSIIRSTLFCARLVIPPNGRVRLLWDLCALVLFLLDMWLLPLVVFFLTDEGIPQAFRIVEIGVTSFFAADVVLNFLTGFTRKDKLIMDPVQIAERYLKSWFWADVVATMPWYMLIGGITHSSNLFSTVRAAKFTKAFKLLKLVRLLRARQLIRQFNHGGAHLRVFWYGAFLVNPLKMISAPLCIAHINGSIFPLTQRDWEASDDFDQGMWRYFKALWWGYMALTGDPITSDAFSPSTLTFGMLSMVITSERIFLLAILFYWVAFYLLSTAQEDARLAEVKNSATMYLRKRKIASKTQIQVLNHVSETGQARKLQQHFKLMVDELPMVLHQKICEELWAKHLMSLGLILHVAHWHNEFISKLAMITREEILASKMILFRAGDAAKEAFFVIDGALTIVTEDYNDLINDFTDGTWLGEKALVNPLLRRSATAVAKSFSTLMNVPGDGFHEILKEMELMELFQDFVSDHMWRGLCGRCGVLGDHFTHNCPLIQTKFDFNRSRTASFAVNKRRKRRFFLFGACAPIPLMAMSVRKSEIAGDLEKFLSVQHLRWLAPLLKDLKALDLEKLKELDMQVLRMHLKDQGGTLTDEEAQALSPGAIDKFVEDVRLKTSASLLHNTTPEEHLVFLSHFKVESGTEAALMCHELESLIEDDRGSPAHTFQTPIFLDSEDLRLLGELQLHVRRSHNFVLLLTEHVLTRPWVLIEIVTAFEAKIRILPVLLLRGFDEFVFPEDSFYRDLHAGKILEQNAMDLLAQSNITLSKVEEALRETFNRIAVPYSPHRPKMIRQSELRSLLQQCHIRRPYMPDWEGGGSRASRYAARQSVRASRSDSSSIMNSSTLAY